MTDAELLPCPFCGQSKHIAYDDPPDMHHVFCAACLAEGPKADSLEDVDAAWNRRAALAAREPLAEVEAVVEAARDARENYNIVPGALDRMVKLFQAIDALAAKGGSA